MVVIYYLSGEYWKEQFKNIQLSYKFFKCLRNLNNFSNGLECKIQDIPYFLERLEYLKTLFVEYKSSPTWREKNGNREEVLNELENFLKFTSSENNKIKEYLKEKKRIIEEENLYYESQNNLVDFGGGSTNPLPKIADDKTFEEILDYEI